MESEKNLYHIAVDGLPGTDKTKLAQNLAKFMSMHVLEESMEDNPYLIYNFERAKNIHFQAQIYFAVTRFQQLIELKQWDLFSHGIIVDFTFERNFIYAQSLLNDSEFYIFEKMYSVLHRELPLPDAVLYLQASASYVQKVIDERNFDFERKEIRRYLTELNQAFNSFYFNYCTVPVLVVNRERVDLNSISEIEGIAFALKNIARGVTRYISQQEEGLFEL